MRKLLGILLLSLASVPCFADDAPDWKAETLTGDWGGVRANLFEHGVTLDLVLKADMLSNVSGGIESGTKYMDNWDVKLRIDAEKLLGWSSTTAYFHVISNHGGKLNANDVGSFMGVDNIEVNTNTTKFFEAWLEKTFFDDKLGILAGLYPIDTEFYVTDATGVFLHPTGGMAAEVAQTGANGPSIFPTSSVGVRAKWQPTPKYYLQAALLDGVPGDPNDPHGTHVRFDRGDGTLAIVETGVRPMPDQISKYAVGYWRYTPRFDDLTDVDALGRPERRFNRGFYGFAEQAVYHEAGDPAQGLALFARYGVASDDVNTLDFSYSAGLHYLGLFPGRDQDEFGVMVTRAHASDKFRQAGGLQNSAYETALEITYRAKITPWLAIQPVVERIINPGFDPALDNAWVAGARFEIAF